MAQWVPKTAWKVSNLNKRYGPGYITSGFSSENTLGYTHMVHDSHKLREKLSSRKGIFVIDVRDPGERKLNPVPRSVALHHHDLLSGASCPILPQQKSAAELFVLASNESRGLNSAAALRRWGYDSVVQVDYNTLVEAGYVSRCDYATAGTKDSAEQAVSGESAYTAVKQFFFIGRTRTNLMTPTVTPLQLPKREGVKPFPDAPLGGAAVEPHALPPKPRTRASSVNDGRKKTTSYPSYMNPLKLPTKAIVWTNKPPVKPNKISVSLENFEDAPRIKGVFNSPRSLKACEIAVVDPRNLLKRPLSHFEGKGVPETLAQMRHTYYENRRKAKLEEVRRIRDGLPVEVPQEKEDEQTNVNGRTPSVNNGHRAPLLRERSPPPMVRQRTPMRRSTSFGFCSRSSSSAPYKVGGEKPYPPSRRTTLHGADGRSPSVGALKVLNRAMSENRSLSAADYDMLRRIEEREERANEARQRAEEMEAARERELLERGLRKELHGINKLIERENERISAVQMRRQKLEMRLQQARERQKRSEEERLGQWNAKR